MGNKGKGGKKNSKKKKGSRGKKGLNSWGEYEQKSVFDGSHDGLAEDKVQQVLNRKAHEHKPSFLCKA